MECPICSSKEPCPHVSPADFGNLVAAHLAALVAESMDGQVRTLIREGAGWSFQEFIAPKPTFRDHLRRRRHDIEWRIGDWADRIRVAWAVLRGRHDCYDY